KAAAKFAELNTAYELLGDEKKRKAFDRGEIDAEGKPRFQGFETAGAGPGPGGVGREGRFGTFTWGPEGVRRARGRREGVVGGGGDGGVRRVERREGGVRRVRGYSRRRVRRHGRRDAPVALSRSRSGLRHAGPRPGRRSGADDHA